MKEKQQKIEEKCVICKKSTGYTFDIDISKRQFYVIGCGQLCETCYKELYKSKDKTEV